MVFEKQRERRRLKRAMNEARTYRDWRAAAKALDDLEGLEAFKRDDRSPHYDHNLIRERLQQVRYHRASGDHRGLIRYLRAGLLRNLGNLARPVLYEQTHTGTKHLIDDYVSEVISAINFVADKDFDWFPADAKLKFFEETLQSYGRSALLLSGGANFGVFHIGVARAMWDAGLLPRVFSGASTGAIIAGMLGTHADDELDRIFRLEGDLRLDPWRSRGLRGVRRGTGLFDARRLEEVVRANLGELTFEEAFAKTGRAINISVSPVKADSEPRLLNYLTAPQLLVWSAVMASCALPLVFPPVVMRLRADSGATEPYMHGQRWIDGSMASDLPMQRLGELYNVNHHIVSQANPHIAPFIDDHEHATGAGKLVKDLALGELHHRTRQAIALLHTLSPISAAERVLMSFDAIVGQQYRGDVTITPPTRPGPYLRLASNLTPEQAERLARDGEIAAWRQMSKVRNQTKIGQTLERCVRRSRAIVEGKPLEAPSKGG
jgi:TAG lipase/steryl ester hydrolase/phospholipase A2/LPA acyltransferase